MGMNTKPSLRTGFAGVWAHPVAAGIIASSKGRASTARPFLKNVRRGMAFFVRNIARRLSLLATSLLDTRYFSRWCHIRLRAPHLKRSALNNSENQRGEAVSVLPGVPQDLANSRRIVVVNAAAESERHEVFRQRSDEQLRTRQNGVFESVDAAELSAAGHSA